MAALHGGGGDLGQQGGRGGEVADDVNIGLPDDAEICADLDATTGVVRQWECLNPGCWCDACRPQDGGGGQGAGVAQLHAAFTPAGDTHAGMQGHAASRQVNRAVLAQAVVKAAQQGVVGVDQVNLQLAALELRAVAQHIAVD